LHERGYVIPCARPFAKDGFNVKQIIAADLAFVPEIVAKLPGAGKPSVTRASTRGVLDRLGTRSLGMARRSASMFAEVPVPLVSCRDRSPRLPYGRSCLSRTSSEPVGQDWEGSVTVQPAKVHGSVKQAQVSPADGRPPERSRNMPKVTVITPNYNHARYLPKRLDSIVDQTFRDFELIILDNASTDHSREVIESYTKDPRVRAFFNAENNGSTFKQWNLGLSHAKGGYIWFAEADDYADPLLLETLVDRLDRHPNVGLAFCQSWAVDEDCNKLSSWLEVLKLQYQSSHWLTDYVNSGHDECTDYLFLHNSIPNASAVLLRREVLDRAGGVAHDMQLAGDWMTYVNVLSISDIAFVSAPLNYFRQHVATVRSRLAQKKVPRRETRRVQRVLAKRYGRRRLLRGCREVLPWYVNNMIYWVRRPPYDEVPLPRALGLLAWFAHIHPMAFGIALRILSWELMTQLARRVGLLGLARKMKSLSASLNR